MKHFHLVFLFAVFPLLATEIGENARAAEVFLEAGDVDRASSLYESLIGLVPQGWQQWVLEYNRANALLVSGKEEEALSVYQQLSSYPLFPELSMRIAFNRAVGAILRANIFEKTFKDDKEIVAVLRTGLWEEAREAVENAFKADCARDLDLGAKECEMDPSVAFLYRVVERGSASVQMGEAVTQKNVGDLISSIEARISGLNFADKSVTIQDVLIGLIREEQEIVRISRFFILDPKKDADTLLSKLEQAQEEIWKAAPLFVHSMQQEQMVQWKRLVLQSTESLWKDIFRLFDEGYVAAKDAGFLLGAGYDKLAEATREGNFAQEKWISALMLLKKMKESEFSMAPQEKSVQPTTAQLMEQLQAMEQDDKSTPHFSEDLKMQKVDQPW